MTCAASQRSRGWTLLKEHCDSVGTSIPTRPSHREHWACCGSFLDRNETPVGSRTRRICQDLAGERGTDSFTRLTYACGDLGKRERACRWATGLLGGQGVVGSNPAVPT